MTVIDSFTGKYEFLSNFYIAPRSYEGVLYPTAEHLYQSLKTTDADLRRAFGILRSPQAAKALGRKVPLRPDWNEYRIEAMTMCLALKFSFDDLGTRLVGTGAATLIEGNTWNDTFWGVCNGVGENHLGLLLMERRAYLAEWLHV